MTLEGKGLTIWKIHHCDQGDADRIARRAKDAGLTHVLIKIADGSRAYNVDYAAKVVSALKDEGIGVWGWQFVYGDEPFREADIAVHRIRTLKLDGFVINAEAAYKKKHEAASAYMESLKPRIKGIPLALSSYRFPLYHPEFPWTEFLSACDINMPQVYWVQSDKPAEQLDRCISQFQDIYPVRPIVPAGAAYQEHGWRPSPEEVSNFLTHARKRGLPAVNFWNWDYVGSSRGEDLWHVISQFQWGMGQPRQDIANRLVERMNRGDIGDILTLYHPDAVIVTQSDIYSGRVGIGNYYESLLNTELPDATFTFETLINKGGVRQIKWDAFGAKTGYSVTGGQDTLQSEQGQIHYHSRMYHIE